MRDRAGWVCLVLVLAGGCGTREVARTELPHQGATLRVATVAAGANDPAARDAVTLLTALRGEWEASQKATVQVETQPGEVGKGGSEEIVAFRGDLLGDLFDAGRIAWLTEDDLRPKAAATATEDAPAGSAESAADPFRFNDLLPAYRDHVARYGEQPIALPLGGSALVLVYRRDAFDRPENRQAAEAAGLKLEPPRTYPELEALARFFHGRDWAGDGTAASGICLAARPDAEGVSDAVYLARAAAYGLHPDQFGFLFDDETMEPWVARPPFVEALEGLGRLVALGPEGAAGFDADAARAAFRSGKAALLIDLAEQAPRWTDPKRPVPLGVAALPGAERVYDPDRKAWQPASPPNRPTYLPRGGGWMIGVSPTATGRTRDAALAFMRDLAGPETAARILANRDLPVLPTRTSRLGTPLVDARTAPGVDARSWSRAVSETLAAPRVDAGLRIPEAAGYLADLGAARERAIAGQIGAATALEEAAAAWKARTGRLGIEHQLWHYRRSQNRRTTSSTPPPGGRPAGS